MHRILEMLHFIQDNLVNLPKDVIKDVVHHMLDVFKTQAMENEKEEDVEWSSDAELRVRVNIKGLSGDIASFVESLIERYFFIFKFKFR